MADANKLRRVLVAAVVVACLLMATLAVVFFKTRTTVRERGSESAPMASRDFALSNAVSCVLGGQEHGDGVELADREKDGLSTIVKVGEVPCRLTSQRSRPGLAGYLYFSIDPAFKQAGVNKVKIEVEYFDIVLGGNPVSFKVQYDATGSPLNKPYATAAPSSVRLRGSEMWRTATFEITDATFQNSQNGHSDFRIQADPPELYVRRVSVTRLDEAPTPPETDRLGR